jgi:hypothetical protein
VRHATWIQRLISPLGNEHATIPASVAEIQYVISKLGNRPLANNKVMLELYFCALKLFIDTNDLSVSLTAKLDFAGPPVEPLNAYRR